MTDRITFTELKELARSYGMSARKRDDEYRINFYDGEEATAYYTSDIQDAFDTAVAMSTRRWPRT